MLLSGKAHALARSRLLRPLRPVSCHIHVPIGAALRPNSSLATDADQTSIVRKQHSGHGRPSESLFRKHRKLAAVGRTEIFYIGTGWV